MKTLWTFTALVLATLYHGSHQKPSQPSRPSQSSSESKYCNFCRFFLISKSSEKSFCCNFEFFNAVHDFVDWTKSLRSIFLKLGFGLPMYYSFGTLHVHNFFESPISLISLQLKYPILLSNWVKK